MRGTQQTGGQLFSSRATITAAMPARCGVAGIVRGDGFDAFVPAGQALASGRAALRQEVRL